MKLDDLKMPHLQELARENKLKGFTKMTKPDLVKHIRKNVKGRLKMVDGKPLMVTPEAGIRTTKAIEEKAPIENQNLNTDVLKERTRLLMQKLMGGNISTPETTKRQFEEMSPLTETPKKKRGRKPKVETPPPTPLQPPETPTVLDTVFESEVPTVLDTVPGSEVPTLIDEPLSPLPKPIDTPPGVSHGYGLKWDDPTHGTFVDQLKVYNEHNNKKFKGPNALLEFATMILKDKKKYPTKTQRRANFYLNVLAKKKSD